MRITCPIKHIFIITLFLSLIVPFTFRYARADECATLTDAADRKECEEIAKELAEKQSKYESTATKLSDIRSKKNGVSSKISELSSQLNVTQEEINEIQAEIDSINKALNEINNNLSDRRGTVEEKLNLRNTVIRNYAKTYRVKDIEFFSSFLSFQGNTGFSVEGQSYGIAKYLANELSSIIYSLNQEIDSFEKDKKEAESLKDEMTGAQNSLLAVKRDLDAKKNSAQGEFNELGSKEDSYEGDLAELEKEISELSSKQQSILQAKGGEFSASLSQGVETDDPRASPNYNPGFSPAFGVFSYGAYTHRNGMSQHGALGRALDGQEYDDILKFYYKTGIEEKDGLDDKTICVNDGGNTKNMKMGEYLKGIGEMPPSWHEEALKAQVVAARTYAYRYTKNGGCICTSTNCQYFHKDLVNRSDRNRWYEAIEDTENVVLEGDVSAQYSKSTGGWINGVGWDVKGSWPNGAYEIKGDSEWFYKAWFTQTYNKNSSTCGRSHPWLTGEEMADILNAYVLLKAGKNTERVVPETLNKCPLNGISGKPYSKDELRDKADDIDKGFKEVKDVLDVNFDTGKGKTSSIVFQTDQGNYTVDGQLFMEAFNVRAPGYIAIKYSPDSKALYDILKK